MDLSDYEVPTDLYNEGGKFTIELHNMGTIIEHQGFLLFKHIDIKEPGRDIYFFVGVIFPGDDKRWCYYVTDGERLYATTGNLLHTNTTVGSHIPLVKNKIDGKAQRRDMQLTIRMINHTITKYIDGPTPDHRFGAFLGIIYSEQYIFTDDGIGNFDATDLFGAENKINREREWNLKS